MLGDFANKTARYKVKIPGYRCVDYLAGVCVVAVACAMVCGCERESANNFQKSKSQASAATTEQQRRREEQQQAGLVETKNRVSPLCCCKKNAHAWNFA